MFYHQTSITGLKIARCYLDDKSLNCVVYTTDFLVKIKQRNTLIVNS